MRNAIEIKRNQRRKINKKNRKKTRSVLFVFGRQKFCKVHCDKMIEDAAMYDVSKKTEEN